jgi:hypothetical protein
MLSWTMASCNTIMVLLGGSGATYSAGHRKASRKFLDPASCPDTADGLHLASSPGPASCTDICQVAIYGRSQYVKLEGSRTFNLSAKMHQSAQRQYITKVLLITMQHMALSIFCLLKQHEGGGTTNLSS